MFVRKSNNRVHIIFKDTRENIKVSTFAADGKRELYHVTLLHCFHKKNQKLHHSFTYKRCFRLFLCLLPIFGIFLKSNLTVCRERFFNLYRHLFSSEKTNGFDKTGTNEGCVILWFSSIISAVMQEQFFLQERDIEIELEHIFTREQNNSHSLQRVQPPIKASQLAKEVSAKSNFVDSWSSFMCAYNLKKGREPQ